MPTLSYLAGLQKNMWPMHIISYFAFFIQTLQNINISTALEVEPLRSVVIGQHWPSNEVVLQDLFPPQAHS